MWLHSILVTRIVSVAIGLLALRAITGFLSKEEMGMVSLLTVTQTFCGLFLISPIGQYINIKAYEWKSSGTLILFLKKYQLFLIIVAFIGIFATYISINNIDYDGYNKKILYFTMGFWIFYCSWNGSVIGLLNIIGERTQFIKWTLITTSLSLFFSVLFCIIEPTAIAWIGGQLIGYSIGSVGALKIIKAVNFNKNYGADHNLVCWPELISYSFPLYAVAGFMWFQQGGYRYFIASIWGLENLAVMAIGMQIAAQIFGLIESTLSQIISPFFYKNTVDKTNDAAKRTIIIILDAVLPIYIIALGSLICYANYLEIIMVGGGYTGAIVFLKIGAIIEFLRITGNLMSNLYHAELKTKKLIFPNLLSSITIAISIYYAAIMNYKLEIMLCGIILGYLLNLLIIIYKEKIKIAKNFYIILSISYIALINIDSIIEIKYTYNIAIKILSLFLSCLILCIFYKRNAAFKRIIYD